MDKIIIKNVKLKMWEKTLLPESVKENNIWTKTGKKIEKTIYTFVDEWGSKLVFMSGNSTLRSLETSTGDLVVALGFDDFKKINKIQFVDFIVS